MPIEIAHALLPWALFTARTLERAQQYVAQGRVYPQTIRPQFIQSSCEGSGDSLYRQDLSVVHTRTGRITYNCECSCPVRRNCKHCAAVLLLLHERGDLPDAFANPQLPSGEIPEPTVRRVEGIRPVPRLRLASLEFSAFEPRNGRMQRQVQHRAALGFDYAGHYAWGMPAREIVHEGPEETLFIPRDSQFERAMRQRLANLGLRPSMRQSKVLPPNAGELYEMLSDSAWLNLTLNDLPQLREAGWDVRIDEHFGFDLTPIEGWYANVESPNEERDWFDLEVGIEINGRRLSLLPILLSLLRSQTAQDIRLETLAKRGDHELVLAHIPDPTEPAHTLQVALPIGRLKPVLATLGNLFDYSPGQTRVRMNKADAVRLNHLDEAVLDWQGGERIRSLGQKLAGIGLQAVAPPAGLNATLRPYQLEGLNWMQALRELESGGVLADDMGLGKTLQSLAHILLEKEAGRLDRPALVVMPTSLVPNWLDEAARFAPALKVLALQGPGRRKHWDKLGEYDLLLTTYALLPKDQHHFEQQPLHLLILDEAQNIKSASSKAAQAARALDARQRLALSGTPLENHLGELWSLFHFLMPGWLGDAKQFTAQYRTPIERQGNVQRLEHLNARIKPFLLRRTKEQVATELPPKTETTHWVELNDAQRDVYETLRLAMDKKVRDEISKRGMARSQIVILDALLKLRQVCCDLRLVDPEAHAPRAGGAGKLPSLLQMLDDLLAEGRRVLVFSQFTSMLALIRTELEHRHIRYSLLTGDTHDRRKPVEEFQQGQSQVFLISLKAGGVGLNLTAADTVIHFDPWWNPAAERQATDRAYRIGQDKPVFVYKLITRGTVEEKIQALQSEKSALAASILEGRQTGDWKLSDEDLAALFAPLP